MISGLRFINQSEIVFFHKANNYSNKNHIDKFDERRARERDREASKKALWILRRPITFCSSLSFYQFPTFRTRHLQRLCLFISSQTVSNVRQTLQVNTHRTATKEIENENKNISAHFTFHLFIWKMSTKMIADSH